ncbi:uncharacterized protein LOC124281777 [Haliotis rubra]|uniref:uncharacterized protein LOC124281777 n=1 Tax=Haliotis rubra TaxID=36100 RepID=UPI001EE63135|nr:uncharacterized protein LOC124281777 [Haliotis rubra]
MKVLFVCVVLLYIAIPTESGVAQCPNGQFLDMQLDVCKNCSTCPKNQIIRKPCHSHGDTMCGPFREFIDFNQRPDEGGLVDEEHAHPDHHKHGKHHKGHHQGKKNHHKSTDPTSELSIVSIDDTTDPAKSQGSILDLTSAVSSSEHQWKTLAMALIGILCIVSVSLVLFVFAACYIRSKRQALEKEMIYDPEMMECQSAYVQVQPYEPARDRLKSKSNIRAVREFQQNAYDSGSDDSCGNPHPPSSQLLGQLIIGPIVDDYDADNSGQTITTTKSSDYVYFNSPQNANGEP